MLQCPLRDVLIVELDVAGDGIAQVLAGAESSGIEDLGDAAVEALDHAVGLRMSGLDESVIDGVLGADLVEGMMAGGVALSGSTEAVRELLAVIGEDLGDLEGSGLDQAFEEGAGVGGGLGRQDFEVDPAGGAVDGGEEILACALIGHLGQVFDIDVHEAWRVVLEALGRCLRALLAGYQVREPGDPVAAQTAIQARARHLVVDKLMGDREEVIERQQQELAQFYDQDLLGCREIRMQGVGPMRGILDGVAFAPLAHGDRAEVIAPGQDLVGLGGPLKLTADCGGGTGVFMEVELHGSGLVVAGHGRARIRWIPDAVLALGGASGRPPGSPRRPLGPSTPKPLGHGTKGSFFSANNHTGRDT